MSSYDFFVAVALEDKEYIIEVIFFLIFVLVVSQAIIIVEKARKKY